MKDRKGIKEWIYNHKSELLYAGVGLIAVGIVIYKNSDQLNKIWLNIAQDIEISTDKNILNVNEMIVNRTNENLSLLKSTVTNHTENVKFIEITNHVRNLPTGWQASSEKVLKAKRNGYHLGAGQTWVESYTKSVAVA